MALNRKITDGKHLLHTGRVFMQKLTAMKNYILRLYNWFTAMIRKVFKSRTSLISQHSRYTWDKQGKTVLFI